MAPPYWKALYGSSARRKTGYTQSGLTQQQFVYNIAQGRVSGLLDPSQLNITVKYYKDFNDIRQLEPCINTPPCGMGGNDGVPNVDFQDILDGINLLQPNGSTELTAGLEWGWRMISPRWQGLWGGEMDANNLPQPYSTPYISKQIIFVTDGINQSDSRYYSSYGFTSPNTSASDPTNPDPYNVNLLPECLPILPLKIYLIMGPRLFPRKTRNSCSSVMR